VFSCLVLGVRWRHVEVLCSANGKCFQVIRGLKDSAVARILFFEDSCNDLILPDNGLTMYKKKKKKKKKEKKEISQMNWFCHSCDVFFQLDARDMK